MRVEVGHSRDPGRRPRRARHPLSGKGSGEPSLLEQLEESLHPWIVFVVLPLFAFANAGGALNGLGLSRLFEPVALGVLLGRLLGKPLGILAATFLAVASKVAAKPRDARWDQMVASPCWVASASR